MKTFLVLAEGLTAWGLVKLLNSLSFRREQVLLYAWCPMLIWEIGGAGHLDALAMTFITLALLSRYRQRATFTGLFLGLAVLTKMYPIVLFPALYRRGDWQMPATLLATIAFGYACYSSVGTLVFGFLGEYTREEGMRSGARYFLLDLAQHIPGLHHLPIGVFYVLCAGLFGTISLWAWKTCCKDELGFLAADQSLSSTGAGLFHGPASFLPPATALASALMFLFSPHYSWYVVWLVPFFCLLPNLPLAVYLMGFFYGYTTWLADPGPKMYLLNQRIYGVTLLACAVHLAFKASIPYRTNFLANRLPDQSDFRFAGASNDFQRPETTR